VSANGNRQAESLDCDAANNEDRALRRVAEEHDRGYREKESGWQDK
jgi:hypothetical protein